MSDTSTNARARKAVGPERPTYLDGGDVDRVMAVLLALISEVASIRERLDTHERIGVSGSPPTAAAVEAYQADDQAEASREVWRNGYIQRLFRVLSEDVEALKAGADVTL